MAILALKWNFAKIRYEPYMIPDEWHCPLVSDDMDEPINCASCGKGMTFGEGYTSRAIHTPGGFGYFVCEDCLQKEIMAERTAREEE